MSRAIAVALAVLLAGCTAGPAGLFHEVAGHADPPTDVLGWENGVWYDEPIPVDASDGLNETERELVVARAMARIEHLRGLEFKRSVPVEVISREEFRLRRNETRTDTFEAFNNQVWEALFLVDEDTDVRDAIGDVYGATVRGYYSPSRGEIVVVSDDPSVTIGRGILAHELVHALQHQHFGLDFGARSHDATLAEDALVEGDANLIEHMYTQRCFGPWECLPVPESSGSVTAGEINYGLFVTIFLPYSGGPTFVNHTRNSGGWGAVNDLYGDPPRSTEQVIHPEAYGEDPPANVTVADRASGGWARFTPQGSDSETETLGEASLYAMFWANGVIPRRDLFVIDELATYNYDHPTTDGWEGDVLVPYRDGDRFGYVFKSTWESPDDAQEFAEAYRELLETNNATKVRQGVWRIPDEDGFGDAFRVVRRGDTVVIVNAPTVEDLPHVHRPRE